MNELSRHEREIIERLSEDSGFVTGDVAKGVTMFGHNARTHSGAGHRQEPPLLGNLGRSEPTQ